ncbi:Aldehyde/histidinol dehydrogenase [Cristinia sonorae]|uniref:Aldehyde dehydrogenase n=1 Tax=Cristinia sonorae TaxID=1940300 RepID=A0A8K0UTH2_9AGAR|nr:Aldehyde/histidinol dehydrogenase [Cristinia sonorae]
MMQDNVAAIEEALHKDLGKARQEVAVQEIGSVLTGALRAVEHLEEWAKPEKPAVEPWKASWDVTVYKVPKGVALIISPWNYPFVLTFNPLIGAIAAGCPAVLKPSESAPASSTLMKTLVEKYLDPEAYILVNGAIPETNALLKHRWDHIFFTGGTKIGKVIATVAAQNLTPVTLELGGKSPVIIDDGADLQLAAKRTLWGKSLNSGQLCVSPDHVYVPRHLVGEFKEAVKKAYAELYPEPALSTETGWGKIVNPTHHSRVKKILEQSQGEILLGGEIDGDKRIAPTVVAGVKPDDALMQEEIFGPVLPIIEVENVDESIRLINEQPSPLVIYAFTQNEETKQKLITKTQSGSLIFNDTTMQLAVFEMPFGGVGESGNGGYYDKDTFDIFSHRRSTMNVPYAAEPYLAARYRPYTDEKYAIMSGDLRVKIPEQ